MHGSMVFDLYRRQWPGLSVLLSHRLQTCDGYAEQRWCGFPRSSRPGLERCTHPKSGLFTEKALHVIAKATSKSTKFDFTATLFHVTKVTSASLLTFYAERDAEHCQSYYARTSIPGSSIGDISPCVEQLYVLSSQSFTNERRAYQPDRTRSASIWHGMPTALVRNKPSQN